MLFENRIVDAANIGYPISIIIIGIGDSDFKFVQTLDGDNKQLKNSKGEKMQRDIVQFVRFEKYRKTGDIHGLARETLQEVPKQFLSYVSKLQGGIPKRQETNINDRISKFDFNLTRREIRGINSL